MPFAVSHASPGFASVTFVHAWPMQSASRGHWLARSQAAPSAMVTHASFTQLSADVPQVDSVVRQLAPAEAVAQWSLPSQKFDLQSLFRPHNPPFGVVPGQVHERDLED